jgi:hypothetical protein
LSGLFYVWRTFVNKTTERLAAAGPLGQTTAIAAPTDLPALKGAPERLRNAEAKHERATEALAAAEDRRAGLAKKLSSAKWEQIEATEAFEREQSAKTSPARGLTITQGPSFEGQDRSIGPQGGGQAIGPDYGRQTSSPALRRYASARDTVGALQPLLDRLDTITLPDLRESVDSAMEAMQQAQPDADRLEAAKVTHAAAELASVDAGFSAAAAALDQARIDCEAVRDQLLRAYGFDERFSIKLLAGHLSPGIIALVDMSRMEREVSRRVEQASYYAPTPAGPIRERGLTITEDESPAPRSLEARRASTGGLSILYGEEAVR